MGKTKKKMLGFWIGLAGALLTMGSLYMPFAEAGAESKSLVGMARLYVGSDSAAWHNKTYETFYKIFVPTMVTLILIFTLLYIFTNRRMKPVGMIVSNILTIATYEILKWDFADRRVVPGACDKGIAFTVIYIAFAIMTAGTVVRMIERKNRIARMKE